MLFLEIFSVISQSETEKSDKNNKKYYGFNRKNYRSITRQ